MIRNNKDETSKENEKFDYHKIKLPDNITNFEKFKEHFFPEDKEVSKENKVFCDKSINLKSISSKLEDVLIDDVVYHSKSNEDYALRRVKKLTQALGLRETPFKVKARKNGVTASGLPNECHGNVTYMVEKFGGKQVIGYMLTNQGGEICLSHHSVWETPEGKLADVTAKGYGKDYTYFYPLKTFDPSVEKYFPRLQFKIRENIHEGVDIISAMSIEDDNQTVPLNWFKRVKGKLADFILIHDDKLCMNADITYAWYLERLRYLNGTLQNRLETA